MPGERILICNDCLPRSLKIQQTLESRSYKIIAQASSGQQAIEQAEQLRPDLALVQVNLPGSPNGPETARTLFKHLNIPVIFTADPADEITTRRISASSTFGFINHPDDVVDLVTNVEIALVKHRSQENLRSQEAYYRGLFENAHDAILVVDPESRTILDVNQRGCEMYGFSRVEMIGAPCSNFLPDTDSARHDEKFLGNGKTLQDARFHQHKKDGSQIIIETNATQVSYHSRPAILCINRDITHRVRSEETLKEMHEQLEEMVQSRTLALNQANEQLRQEIAERVRAEEQIHRQEQALRESEERYRLLVESSPMVTIVLEKDIIRFVNQSGMKHLGFRDQPEVVGRSILEFVKPGERAEILDQIAQVMKDSRGVMYLEREWFPPNAAPLQVEIAAVRVERSEGPVLQLIIRDISLRKRLEMTFQRQALLGEMEMTISQSGELESLLDRVAQIITCLLPISMGVCIVQWDAAQNVFKRGYNKLVSGNIAAVEQALLDKHGPSGVVTSTRQPLVIPDIAQTRLNGGARLLLAGVKALVAVPIQVDEALFGVLYLLDCTPVNYAHHDIDFLAQVSNRVALAIAKVRLYETLVQAKNDAEEAYNARALFLANISHELRTPLTAVISLTELLQDTSLDVMQKGFVETINLSAGCVMALINDLLDFTKIEARKLKLESQPVEVRASVENALELVAAQAEEKGLILAYSIDEKVPNNIYTDPVRLSQVLTNLLTNAVKYTDRGHVLLTVKLTSPQQSRHTKTLPRRSNTLLFSIRDTGVGIPPDQADLIFDPFTQVNSTARKRTDGVGLGLTITHHLVELLGGEIWMESAGVPGQGSTFSFSLPVLVATGPLQPYQVKNQPVLSGKKVFVACSSGISNQALTEPLEYWGMTVRSFSSLPALLSRLERDPSVHLVLIDQRLLPVNDNYLMQSLYEHASRVPTIICASNRSLAEVGEAPAFAGALKAPVRVPQLFTLLTRLLSKDPGGEIDLDRTALPLLPANLRVLIAEDNPTLASAITMQVERLGYSPDQASCGTEVLHLLNKTNYDLILMDLRMPDMDGVEATRHIRSRNHGTPQPYIIALTADTRPEIREQMRQSGVNDFLTKPVRLHSLKDAFVRMVETIGQNAVPDPAPQVDENEDTLDDSILRDFAEAMGSDAGPAQVQLFDSFLNHSPGLVESIRQSLEEQDWQRCRLNVHTLKGNSSLFGATRLFRLCSQMEDCLQDEQFVQAGELFKLINASYLQLCATLQRRRAQLV